ncbi:hypothetical protein RhiirB3_484821 [Rhizophagus irregularis]|uniref:Uncharacterized protein n=2 Tax=Rhizophagus irregularis TaxID=588596 RepID=A0A2I1E4E2_9GLOM|nr:hypothetical protein RhiirC2_864495 [Rhizophagus irregularis]PKY16971.1 hypothetical protein RhiirB3_484821 [Rhizophagus irregularis]
MASTLPFEILIEIFSYLHPKDLYSLSLVCKRYRTLLWSKISTTTQDIWRTSRIRYILHPTFDPPEKMSEQQYNYLLMVVNSCQFCGECCRYKLAMHWEFRIFCCHDCLLQRCISRNSLMNDWKVSGELLACLQQVITPPRSKQKLFLVSDIIKTLSEYHDIEAENKRLIWIQEKQSYINNMIREHKKYKAQFELIRLFDLTL